MTNHPLNSTLDLTPQQRALLMDRAKTEAQRLRREAIDAFAGALARAAHSALDTLRRAVLARRRASIHSQNRLSPPCRR